MAIYYLRTSFTSRGNAYKALSIVINYLLSILRDIEYTNTYY